jgi:MFS-type transporter involved in bile tolerance (Atg22 family)
MTTATEQYSKHEQRGWCLYDAANSVFATSAIALFLGPYVGSLAKAAADAQGYVNPFGVPMLAEAFWGYLVGFSVFTQALLLPIVGALADFSRKKREWLAGTAFVGSCAAASMFFLQGSNYLLAAALFIIANGCFGASIVVYNSFLPEIAPPDQRDGLSSKGWALGYGAGCLMLIAHLVLLGQAEKIGITQTMAGAALNRHLVGTVHDPGIQGTPQSWRAAPYPQGRLGDLDGVRSVRAHAEAHAPVSEHAEVPGWLPALQRRDSNRVFAGRCIREVRTRPR